MEGEKKSPLEGRDAAAKPQQCALNGTLLANHGEQAVLATRGNEVDGVENDK